MPNLKEGLFDIAKFIDPTGVLSWKDAATSIQKAYKNPSVYNIGSAALTTAGALPIIGKVGKVGKGISYINKMLYKYAKFPTIISKIPGGLIRKGTKINNNLILTTRAILGANRTDNDLLDGRVKRGMLYDVSKNSLGDASPFALLGMFFRPKKGNEYSGMVGADQNQGYDLRRKHGNLSPIKQAIYGNGNFEPYTKPLYLNGKKLLNTYLATLIPIDTLFLTKDLKPMLDSIRKLGKLYLNSERIDYGDKPFVDSHIFSARILPDKLRAIDIWDLNSNSSSGLIFNDIVKPNKTFSKSGAPTFVLEIPIKYTNNKSNWNLVKNIIER